MRNIINILPVFMRPVFDGRINRKRYFFYSLPLYLIQIILWICLYISIEGIIIEDKPIKFLTFLFIYSFFAALILICQISQAVRRMQDLNKKGFFALFLLLFPTNILIIPYLYFAKGTEESNKYGENPLNYKNYSDYLKTLQNSKLP